MEMKKSSATQVEWERCRRGERKFFERVEVFKGVLSTSTPFSFTVNRGLLNFASPSRPRSGPDSRRLRLRVESVAHATPTVLRYGQSTVTETQRRSETACRSVPARLSRLRLELHSTLYHKAYTPPLILLSPYITISLSAGWLMEMAVGSSTTCTCHVVAVETSHGWRGENSSPPKLFVNRDC